MIQVEIRWPINPFRGDKFAEGWLPSKAHWERYWYSERMAQYRIGLAGCYQVPILPAYWDVLGAGEAAVTPAQAAPS